MDMADATTDLEKLGKEPKSRVKTSYESERRKVSSVFAQGEKRFDSELDMEKQGVRILTSKSAPRRKFVTQTLDNKAIMQD